VKLNNRLAVQPQRILTLVKVIARKQVDKVSKRFFHISKRTNRILLTKKTKRKSFDAEKKKKFCVPGETKPRRAEVKL
jgi:hypothetical protein